MTAVETVTDTVSDAVVNSDPATVTVWSDIGCPWATLALHTLRSRAPGVLIDHRAFPLELFNSAPTPKVILDVEIVAIAGARPELGWKPWTAPDSTYPVTMLPPMEAVQAAKSASGLRGSAELDAALRHAFYAEGRCISVHAVILDVAAGCEHVNEEALADALARGEGRAEVYRDWRIAQGPRVQGSPHLFTAGGYAAHNPGANYHWTARPPIGFPRLESYRPEWVEELRASLDSPLPT